MKKIKRSKYPKYNGKPLSKEQKTHFDHFKMKFFANIKLIDSNSILNRELIECITWNCAYEVITSNYYEQAYN